MEQTTGIDDLDPAAMTDEPGAEPLTIEPLPEPEYGHAS
jgi:hypothetical protein